MGVVLYGNDDLHHTIHTLDHELDQLKYGNTTADIPPPPTQAVSDALFQVGDKWAIEKQLLLGTADAAGVDHIVEAESLFMDASVVLVSAMIDAAWDADKTVQGTKISTAGNQVMLIEKMLKEATLIVMQHSSTTTENLMATIHDYERGFELLMGGNMGAHGSGSGSSSGRRLAATLTSKTDVPATTERAIVYQMNSVQEKFNILKAKLDKVIESGTATADELTEMVSKAHYVEADMDEALVFYVSHTRTTTSIPIDVLAPVPLTGGSGGWDAGHTMRVSAMVAEALINDEQMVMPGYGIYTAFYDDGCDTQTGTQVILEQVASNDAYVGLTGMGCSQVCESTAFVASSMRMPFLSYECAGNNLADTTTYPDFTRFGTTTTNVPALVKEFSDMWGWDNIVIISGDPSIYRERAEDLQAALVDLGIMTDYVNSYDDDWLQIKEMMSGLKTQKKRYLYVMSTESFFRKVICGSILAEANIGITWMSEGTRHHEWWKDADPELLALAPECTPEALTLSYEGAINFAGLGRPMDVNMTLPLDCFQSQTAESLLATIDYHLAEGFESTDADNEAQGLRDATVEDSRKQILVDAFQAFKTSWDAFADTDAERLAGLQKAYITDNPNPLGSKDVLDYAPGYEAYHATHKQYHPAWRATLYERNYYDIFMFDLAGNCIYSVYKELDYATNLQTGEWKDSGLGEAFRAAIANPNVVSEIPWKPYGPSFGALASFLSTGIKDNQGNLIGVFSTQFPPSAKPSNTAVLAR